LTQGPACSRGTCNEGSGNPHLCQRRVPRDCSNCPAYGSTERDIWAVDVLNAYITAPCRDKIWTTLGKEFGDDCGRKAIVVRALYGLKSSGAAFRAHLAGCMHGMGYMSCPAYPDLWLKEQTDRKGRRYFPASSIMLMIC
jgi:hypothetical protein